MPATNGHRSFYGRYRYETPFSMLVLASLLMAACDRPAPRQAQAGLNESTDSEASIPQGLDPTQTVEHLRQMRKQGRYSLIEPFLQKSQCVIVIAKIRAVDRLVVAGAQLRNRVREHMGVSAAQSFDGFSQLGNIAGVFSEDVSVVGQHVDGDRAEIRYSVAGRLPLKTVDLLRRDGRWTMQTDSVEGVPELLLKLAFLLERMSDRMVEGPMTLAELHHEIELRQSAIMRRLRKLIAAAEQDRSAKTPDVVHVEGSDTEP